jgi:ABC-2 type transport system ATP-binding protein
MIAIEINNVEKSYHSLKALGGVSLAIEEGEFFGLLGPNGAGKTTLISTIAGLIVRTPAAWRHGHDVITVPQRPHELGVVPQELVFDPFFTVREALRIQSGYFGLRTMTWIDEIMATLISPRPMSTCARSPAA